MDPGGGKSNFVRIGSSFELVSDDGLVFAGGLVPDDGLSMVDMGS